MIFDRKMFYMIFDYCQRFYKTDNDDVTVQRFSKLLQILFLNKLLDACCTYFILSLSFFQNLIYVIYNSNISLSSYTININFLVNAIF